MIDTWLALVILASAVLLGLVLVAVGLFTLSGSVKKVMLTVDDLRAALQMSQEERSHAVEEQLKVDRRALELSEVDRKARVDVRRDGTLKLFEERQEFKIGYFIVALGSSRVVADRIRAVLVNRRDPDLSWTLEALYNVPLGPDQSSAGEITVTIRDLAKVNLPYVPEFSFLRESCKLVMTVEYAEVDGKQEAVERDVLEW
jgi:hypothetical protein